MPCIGTCDSGSNYTPPLDTSNNEPLKSVEGAARLAELGSLIPGLNVPFSIAAATIRIGQGNFKDAAWDSAAVIPLGGLAGKVARGGRLAEEAAHVVYQGINPATKAVEHVGITMRDPAIRWAENALDPTKAHLRFELIEGAARLTKTQARIWEQNLINQHGLGKYGGTLLNKINSVAPKYWSQFGIKP